MTTPDPYEILQIGRDATPEEIKAAYERRSHVAGADLAYQMLKPLAGMDQPGPLFARRRPADPRLVYARLVPLGMACIVLGAAFLVLFYGDWSLSWRLRGWMPERGPQAGMGLIGVGGALIWIALSSGRDPRRARTFRQSVEDEILGRGPDD